MNVRDKNAPSPSSSYLQLIRGQIKAIRRDLPRLTAMAQEMAQPLLKGGRLFPGAVAPFWPNEFTGRAGGFMGMPKFAPAQPKANDVAVFCLGDARRWRAGDDQTLRALMKGKAQLYVVGRRDDLGELASSKRFAGFTGSCKPTDGLYGLGLFQPLATLREFNLFVRGWVLTGELIAACTRAGKMPIIWMSVWLEGAQARNASMFKQDNIREPFTPPLFHSQRYVPPLEAGYAGSEFLSVVEGACGVLEDQQALLARAGAAMARAHKQGQRIWAVATGHSYPQILELPQGEDYPVEWGPSISDLNRAGPSRPLRAGDVSLHVGYSPVHAGDVAKILRRGVRLIYTSPYGRGSQLKDHENLIWFDLPWRPGDACVDVPGYSVRICPSSSAAHTMAYFAMLCEMAERMGWQRQTTGNRQ